MVPMLSILLIIVVTLLAFAIVKIIGQDKTIDRNNFEIEHLKKDSKRQKEMHDRLFQKYIVQKREHHQARKAHTRTIALLQSEIDRLEAGKDFKPLRLVKGDEGQDTVEVTTPLYAKEA